MAGMAVLHMVNKSPFERNTLTSCLRLAREGGSVLFLEDGVLAALDRTPHADKIKAAMKHLKFYVLAPDLQARGLDKTNIMDKVEIIDYAGFVDLAASHETVQAWL